MVYCDVYVHLISNLSSHGRTTDVEIIIKNSNKISLTKKEGRKQQTQYMLTIIDPVSICVNGFNETNIEKFFDKVLLAFNLLLNDGSMIMRNADMTQPLIEKEKKKPQPVKVTKNGKQTHIETHEMIEITNSIHTTVEHKEKIDENILIEIIQKIDRLDSHYDNTIKKQDLEKAFEEYKNAIGNFEMLGIFKALFSALELGTNCDGTDRTSDELDSKASSLSETNFEDIKKWRKFNSRTKHVDGGNSDRARYAEGKSELPIYLTPLRRTVQKILLKRLGQL